MGIDSLKDFYGICKLHELSKACGVFDYAIVWLYLIFSRSNTVSLCKPR